MRIFLLAALAAFSLSAKATPDINVGGLWSPSGAGSITLIQHFPTFASHTEQMWISAAVSAALVEQGFGIPYMSRDQVPAGVLTMVDNSDSQCVEAVPSDLVMSNLPLVIAGTGLVVVCALASTGIIVLDPSAQNIMEVLASPLFKQTSRDFIMARIGASTVVTIGAAETESEFDHFDEKEALNYEHYYGDPCENLKYHIEVLESRIEWRKTDINPVGDESTQSHLDHIKILEKKLRDLEIDYRDFCMNGGGGEFR